MPSLPVKVWTIPRVSVGGAGVDDKVVSSVDDGTGDAVLVGVGGRGVLDGDREGEGEGVGKVSASPVLAVDTAVPMIFASLSVAVDGEPLQDASRMVARNKRMNVLPKTFTFHHL